MHIFTENSEKFKILVVDDSELFHKLIDGIFSEIDILGKKVEIESCYSYKEFLEYYVPDKYAIVITDLVMEENDSGIKVINHIRHELNDSKTRIVLMTANPEKVPRDLLIRDFDVNAYFEKNDIREFNFRLTVQSLLKAYDDIATLERTLYGLEHISNASKKLDLHELMIELFFQIRSYLKFRKSSEEVEGEIFLNGKKIFPPHIMVKSKYSGKTHNYVFEKEINGEIVKIKIKTKSALEETEKNYIKALLVGLKSLYFPGKIDTMSEIESEMVFRIANMINIRSGETGSHVNRVSKISYILAIDYGFSEKEAEYIKNGAVLHDAGKVGIPDEILNKPGKLTDEEFSIMKEHTLLGFEILKNSRLDVFNYAALIALQHHERWDGNGYPYNLSHEEIADEARIVEVADVFEALTHDRCYRPAWPVEKAVEYIVDMSGKQFDPRVVEIFKRRVNDIVNILTNNPD